MMKNLVLKFIWLYDIASNFRRHAFVFGIVVLLIGILFENGLIVVALPILVFSIFPLSSWRYKTRLRAIQTNIQLVVTTFNLEWNNSHHKRCLDFIKNSQSDIIVLQEVTLETEAVISSFKNIFPYQYGSGHSHVMVIAKYELEFINYLQWPGKFNQRALHLTLKLDEKLINLIAIHLQVTRSWREIALRNEQIENLSKAIMNMQGEVILVGDFNANIGSRVLDVIRHKLHLNHNNSLWKFKPTWPTKVGLFGLQLDHIFTSSKVLLLEQQVGPHLESDHKPLTGLLSIID